MSGTKDLSAIFAIQFGPDMDPVFCDELLFRALPSHVGMVLRSRPDSELRECRQTREPSVDLKASIALHHFTTSCFQNRLRIRSRFPQKFAQVLRRERHKNLEILQHRWSSNTKTPLRTSLVSIEAGRKIAMRRMGHLPKRPFKLEARLRFALDFELDYLAEVLGVELKDLFPSRTTSEPTYDHLNRLMNRRF